MIPRTETALLVELLPLRVGQAVIDKVNQDIDVPWISEGRERRKIENLIDKVPKTEVNE